jgi:ribosome-associated heat shock protein Hsp15
MSQAPKIRVDKWLWSVRIFKSRTIATDACKTGKVKISGEPAKPSALVTEGDVVLVKKEGFNFQYRVLQLIEKRVGAPIAVTCYADITPEAEKLKYKSWFTNQAATAERRERGAGRPTKKERREIDDFKEFDGF